jgi:hypothetical protein
MFHASSPEDWGPDRCFAGLVWRFWILFINRGHTHTESHGMMYCFKCLINDQRSGRYRTISSYLVKYLHISSYTCIRKPFLIYDFATAPFFLIFEENLIFFFISSHTSYVSCVKAALTRLWAKASQIYTGNFYSYSYAHLSSWFESIFSPITTIIQGNVSPREYLWVFCGLTIFSS